MARIRTIKPEYWTSEQVVSCSPLARLLFIGLWSFCDDGGVHPASIKRLKMEVFPADAIDDDAMGKLIGELVTADLVCEFDASGERFWHVTGWHRHQRIDKPTIRHPRPPEKPPNSTNARRTFDEPSTNARRDVVEPSPTDRNGVDRNGVEGNGVEGNGVEGNGVEGNGVEGNGIGKEESGAAIAADDVRPSKALKVKDSEKPQEPIPIPAELDTSEFQQAWSEWKEHLRQKRKPMKPLQESKQLSVWAANGIERTIAAINHSIANGWQGLFEPTLPSNGQRTAQQDDPRGNFAAGKRYLEMFGGGSHE